MGRREGEDTQYGRIRAGKATHAVGLEYIWGVTDMRSRMLGQHPPREGTDKLISRSRDLIGKYETSFFASIPSYFRNFQDFHENDVITGGKMAHFGGTSNQINYIGSMNL